VSGVVLARRLAIGAAGAVFMVIVASAWLRHSLAGLMCADWPACYGVVDPPQAIPGAFFARLVHRFAASAALIMVALIPFLALRAQSGFDAERRLAWLALAIALGLAALGIATPGARVPAIALGNLVGGFALLATLVVLAVRLAGVRSSGSTMLALVALLVVFAQVATGGMIGAQFALISCPAAFDCPGADLASVAASGAIDPLRRLEVVAGRVRPPDGAASLVVLHRLLAIVALMSSFAAAWSLRRQRALAGATVLTALGAAVSGAAAAFAQPSLPATLAHNAFAAFLVASLAAAVFRRRPG